MAKNFSNSQIGTFLQADKKEAEIKESVPTKEKKEIVKKTASSKEERKESDKIDVPAGMVLAPEPKTKRLNLLIRPSIYEALKVKAKAENNTVNNLINDILADAIRG